MDINKIKTRWTQCWDSKQDELDRLDKSYLWLFEFERHLRRGEEGHSAYRFPEIMGYTLRRYNNYLEVLPETRVSGHGDGAIALKAASDHFKKISNLEKVKMEAIAHAAAVGSGCIGIKPQKWVRKGKDKGEWVQYSGLGVEHVDWRHIFPAPGYHDLHDHTGTHVMPYLFRRKIYHIDTFKDIAQVLKWKNADKIQPTTWGNSNIWGEQEWQTPHEIEELSPVDQFVTVIEYWDVINDEFRIFGSGEVELFVSDTGIPFSHKDHPYHQYRNIQRIDSINGIGEIELNLPYNLFREKILNLAIDDVQLQIQQPLIVDGAIGLNTEENEVEPGAVWTVRGVAGGKLQDHIMPLPIGGGITQNMYQLIQMIENSRVSVTSDDTTSLYSNPNQLATQTLAKMQTLNKSIDGATKNNIVNTEFYLHNQLCSLIKNELAKPYKDGKLKYHSIKIAGYDVVQDNKDSEVKFVKGYGASGEFSLNQKVSDMFDKDEIEIIPSKQDEELRRDKTEKLMMFSQTLLQTVASLAQTNPALIQQLFGNMDLSEYIKYMAKNLGVESEMQDIFPVVAKEAYELDMIDAEHDQIMMGIVPELREDEDSFTELEKHFAFQRGKFFEKNASKKAKDAMKKHITNTILNVPVQKSKPVASKQGGLANTQGGSVGQGIQSPNGMVGGAPVPSGATTPLPKKEGGMERGLPSRSALASKAIR